MAARLNIKDYLNPQVLSRASEYAQSFREAQPFRHVSIDHFLSDEFCRQICAQFPDFDQQHALNEDGKPGAKATREKVRELGPAFCELDDLVRQKAFRSLVSCISGVERLAYDPYYFGGGTHENRRGQELDPHIDFNFHPYSQRHRRLNLIIYLNDEWDDSWGGALQLHRDPYLEPADDEIVTITPLMNRCVIFETTESSWHGFERIDPPAEKADVSRKSFALYFYTRARPKSETANGHSTVYVDRHLPDRFQKGMTLRDADIEEIKTLLTRRDHHLKRLYRQIYEFENSTSRKVIRHLRAIKRLVWPRKDRSVESQ